MSGTLVPYVNGSPEDYAEALDRLHAKARALDVPGRTPWAPTLAWCTALTLGLALVLPWMPEAPAGGRAIPAPPAIGAVAAILPPAPPAPPAASGQPARVLSASALPAGQARLAGRRHHT